VAEVDEDLSTDPIRPDEISPELLYTAEHQVLTLPAKPTPAPPPSPTTVREGEGPSRRRRGRRGGRRGRGEDSQSGNQ
jgi:hypothetical protein